MPTISRPFRLWLLGAACGLASCGSPTAPMPPATAPVVNRVAAADRVIPVEAPRPKADPDRAYREGLVGVWKQFETGVRWLRVRPDGTATMVIDPDWIARAVIGGRLTIDIEWTVEDGRARFRSVAGRPAAAFETVSTLFGRDRDRPIETLSPDEFVLLDESDGSRSVWTRLPETESPPPELGG